MTGISRLLILGLALASRLPLAAQVSFPGSYSQNFDSLGTSGTNLASLTGWSHLGNLSGTNASWTNSTGIPVTGTPSAATAGTAGNTLTVNSNAASATATSNTAGFNFALSGSTSDRCIGTSPTSGAGNIFQLRLTNNSASALNGVRISYDIRRFTAPSTANEVPGYRLFYSLDNGTSWTNVSALNPALTGATVNVPNTAGVTSVALTSISFATSVAVGAEVRFRWIDDNATETSPDQIIGLDNVVIQALQPPPAVTLTAPTGGESFALPTTINLAATAGDSNGTVTKVEFYANATKIGEDLTEPYELAWSGMISGSYSLTAKATDNDGDSTTSAAVSITVTNPGNVAPAAAITSPAEGALVPADSHTITAAATDTDGVISRVEFFDGTTKIGEDTTSPYSLSWAGILIGSHTLTVKATDNDGAVTTSAAITVQAVPFTDITSISRGSTWKYLDDGTDQGTAWKDTTFDDSAWQSGPAKLGYEDGAVTLLRQGPSGMTSSTKYITYYFRRTFTVPQDAQVLGLAINVLRDDGVVIYVNGVEAGRSNMPTGTVNYLTESASIVSNADETTYFPLTLNPALLVPGENVIAVSLHQRDNASSDLGFDLDLITRVAGGNALPLTQITAPAAGSSYFAGSDITITASAQDQDLDGSVTKVEFYANGSKIGEDLTAPYEYVWTNVSAGSKSLTAVATDNLGSTGTSPAVSVTVSAGPSGTLTRGPYLNMASSTQIVVRWRSTSSVIGRVYYGTSPAALTQFTDEASAKTDHEVKLTGLQPYTRYYYSVGSNAGDKLTPQSTETTSFSSGAPAPTAADYTFRTSPAPGTATPTRVWIVGDCGRGTSTQANGRNAYYSFMGSRVPDLCLMLGDNAYNSGTDTEYQTGYFSMYDNIFRKMPQWSTLGNHDANNGTTNPTTNYPYFDMFTFPTAGECGGVPSGTEHYYSFDYGNIHFICLDSQTTLANSSASAPQTVWLKNDLASTTATWIVAFFHHPIYSKGSHDSDSESQMVTMRQVYAPILEAGGCDLIFVGHSHNYERSFLMSGHYGTTGTITQSMRKQSGNGSLTGFTTSASGVMRKAPSFTAASTTAGTVIPGDGAYTKPLTGPRDGFGTVYNTAGMSGLADAGSINHTAMYLSYNLVGTVNLDADGSTLTCTFVQSGGATPDNFTIVKQGYADSDGDGMSDEWELANGLNRFNAGDAGQLADGETRTHMERYLLGLSDGKTNYPWQTSAPDPVTGHVSVSFPTLPDRKYQVFWSTDLITWNPASAEITGDGTTRVWMDDGSITGSTPGSTPDKKRFYRVNVRTAQ